MKKIMMFLSIVVMAIILGGCNQSNNKKVSGNTTPPLESLSLEVLPSITYVDGDTYGYEKVDKYSSEINFDTFCQSKNLYEDGDYYLIDNYSEWCNIYCEITSCVIDPLPEEAANKLYENKVQLLCLRKATASNKIKVIYQFDNNKLLKSYPHETEAGDQAIFNCLDIVDISKENYRAMTNNVSSDTIPFEIINDQSLEEFYKNVNVLINRTEGFPPTITNHDLESSIRYAELLKKYNEEYFKTYALGIVNFRTCSSEKNINLKAIKFENGKMITIFDLSSPEANTKDLIVKNFIFQIKKEDIEDLTLASYDINIMVNNTLDSSRGSYYYDKYVKTVDKTNSHQLTINDPSCLLLETLDETYQAGERIVVKVGIIVDVEVEVFLDNKSVGLPIEAVEDNRRHLRFYFEMPNHDATLTIRISKIYYNEYVEKYLASDVLSHGRQNEIVFNYLYNYETTPLVNHKGYIKTYYGYYNDTYIVKMSTNKSVYYDGEWTDIVDGVKFYCDDNNVILAYKSGIFYRLQEAFDKGLLTHDDLVSASQFNEQKYTLSEILGFSITEITTGWYSPGDLTVVYGINEPLLDIMVKSLDVEYVELLDNANYNYKPNQYGLHSENNQKTVSVLWTEDDYVVIGNGSKQFLSICKVKDVMELSDVDMVPSSIITIELANEIKLAYAKKYREDPTPITLKELDSIGIRHYHGSFNGYHIVMMEGYFGFDQVLTTDIVGSVRIDYSDTNKLLAYKNGEFFSLQEAYDNFFLTTADLKKISKLHKTSNAFDIKIVDDMKDDKKLSSLIDFSSYKYVNVYNIIEQVDKVQDALIMPYLDNALLQRILSSPYEVLSDTILVRKEFEITLSLNPSVYSYNYFIRLYLGENRLYSSIKKELIINVNGINYLVLANRDDLLKLYLYLDSKNAVETF